MSYQKYDIRNIFEQFQKRNNPEDRYASFDYCYNYFKDKSGVQLTDDLERSCLTLGFYLASWGMLRGSSFLLNRSAKHYQPIVEYIATLDRCIWEIDADTLRENIPIVLSIYENIQEKIIIDANAHTTLVTKVMLGVFGVIPAFDQYFCTTFRAIFGKSHGFRSVNRKSLEAICDFYDSNRSEIDLLAQTTFTKDFISGKSSHINYPKSKIIDMYGFYKGFLET